MDLTEEDVQHLNRFFPLGNDGTRLIPRERGNHRGKVLEHIVSLSLVNPVWSIVSGFRASSAVVFGAAVSGSAGSDLAGFDSGGYESIVWESAGFGLASFQIGRLRVGWL